MAHRTPLSQTKVRQGVLAGAVLIEYEYDGLAPTVRLSTSQTVRSGRPSLHSVTRGRANAYVIGPFVPSDTFRRYQLEAGRLAPPIPPLQCGASCSPPPIPPASPFYPSC